MGNNADIYSSRLAVAAGLTVVTTAGAHNHDFVKSLGANYAFDHQDPHVIDRILKILRPGDVVFDSIGNAEAQTPCTDIVSKLGGGKLADVLWPLPCVYDNVTVVPGKFGRYYRRGTHR